MLLYIIRHGQSVNNASGGDPHVPDCPLTELGHQQAHRVAEHLGDKHITHLFTSPMLRAMQTTRPIAEALDLTPEIWVDIHEHGGAVHRIAEKEYINPAGMTRAEIQEAFPGYRLSDRITDEGWWFYDDGLESRAECYARGRTVAAVLGDYAQNAEADDVLALVTHGTFTDALIRGVLDLPENEATYFMMKNTGITQIDFRNNGKRRLIFYHNRVDHLPPEMLG